MCTLQGQLPKRSVCPSGVSTLERCLPAHRGVCCREVYYLSVYLTGVFSHQEFLLPKRGVCSGKGVLYKGVCLTGVFAYQECLPERGVCLTGCLP